MPLYEANEWSAAQKPDLLLKGLINSHSLITAWDGDTLAGLGNAISDGHLVVYYPHLLVLPSYQGKGIGYMIMDKMQEKYQGFHMQMLTADGKAIDLKKSLLIHTDKKLSEALIKLHYFKTILAFRLAR